MKHKFLKDLYRYYGDKGESLVQRILRPTELSYIALFRKAEASKFLPLKLYYTVKLKLKSYKTHIQIPARTKIGEGLYIGHTGRVIINPDAVSGNNASIIGIPKKAQFAKEEAIVNILFAMSENRFLKIRQAAPSITI